MLWILSAVLALVALPVVDLYVLRPRRKKQILGLLRQLGATTGKNLKEACDSGGLYVELHELEEEGLVTSREDETLSSVHLAHRGGRPVRIYELTPAGHHAALAGLVVPAEEKLK